MNEKLVTFKSDITRVETKQSLDQPDVFAFAVISGYSAAENDQGHTVCKIWLTNHKDVIVDWHLDEYRANKSVLELVDDAKNIVCDLWNKDHERQNAVCTLQVYPYIEFEDGSAVICMYTGEHIGGISDRTPMDVCYAVARGYQGVGLMPVAWRPVSKAAYDAFIAKHPNGEATIITWDADGMPC